RGGVDADVDDLGLGDVQHLAATVRLDADVHGDRGAAEADRPRQEADHVADQHRLLELDAVDGDGDQERLRAAGPDDLTPRPDGTRLVDVAQDHAAEDGAVRVRIPRHHHDLDGRVQLTHAVPPFNSRRTIRTPSTMLCSLRVATQRAVCEKPQSGVTDTRSGSMYRSVSRSRSATSSGGSTQVFLTSTS